MIDLEALRQALYLFHLPSAVRAARDRPLPAGMMHMLEVAADAETAAETAAARLERPVDVIRQACGFYIEQIMLAPDADAYRMLGAGRAATDAELRRHMALLLRWVHPDTERAGERSVYAGRVTGAWEALKTNERRAAYDAANPPKAAKPIGKYKTSRSSRTVHEVGRQAGTDAAPRRSGLLGAAFRYILGRRPT